MQVFAGSGRRKAAKPAQISTVRIGLAQRPPAHKAARTGQRWATRSGQARGRDTEREIVAGCRGLLRVSEWMDGGGLGATIDNRSGWLPSSPASGCCLLTANTHRPVAGVPTQMQCDCETYVLGQPASCAAGSGWWRRWRLWEWCGGGGGEEQQQEEVEEVWRCQARGWWVLRGVVVRSPSRFVHPRAIALTFPVLSLLA